MGYGQLNCKLVTSGVPLLRPSSAGARNADTSPQVPPFKGSVKLDSDGTAAPLLAGNDRHNKEVSMTFMCPLVTSLV